MPIKILITGGTFDKEYDDINGTLYFKDTHIPEMLKFGRYQLEINLHTVMMIDSLNMTARIGSSSERITRNRCNNMPFMVYYCYGICQFAQNCR